MADRQRLGFSPEVSRQLRYYVYRLIDPRNGETFYVGKGKGNRVFAHIREEVGAGQDELSGKLQRIREIKRAGFEVGHVIHRHGMDEETAFEVECAVMQAYQATSNIASGSGMRSRGVMHAIEVIERYEAPVAKFRHKVLLININNTADTSSYLEATQYAWKLNAVKAAKAEFVLAVDRGLIVEVFVASKWLPATAGNFPGRATIEGRYGFVGKVAPDESRKLYVRHRLPESYRKRGAANPIKYSWA